MNYMKYYSDGCDTTAGVKVKFDIIKHQDDWDLYIYSFGLLLISVNDTYKIIGVDEI